MSKRPSSHPTPHNANVAVDVLRAANRLGLVELGHNGVFAGNDHTVLACQAEHGAVGETDGEWVLWKG